MFHCSANSPISTYGHLGRRLWKCPVLLPNLQKFPIQNALKLNRISRTLLIATRTRFTRALCSFLWQCVDSRKNNQIGNKKNLSLSTSNVCLILIQKQFYNTNARLIINGIFLYLYFFSRCCAKSLCVHCG